MHLNHKELKQIIVMSTLFLVISFLLAINNFGHQIYKNATLETRLQIANSQSPIGMECSSACLGDMEGGSQSNIGTEGGSQSPIGTEINGGSQSAIGTEGGTQSAIGAEIGTHNPIGKGIEGGGSQSAIGSENGIVSLIETEIFKQDDYQISCRASCFTEFNGGTHGSLGTEHLPRIVNWAHLSAEYVDSQ